MSSLAFLVTELQSLASETRRKHPDVREAAEKSLAILRTSPEQATASLASDGPQSQDLLRPVFMGCATKNAKVIAISIGSLQRLIALKAVPQSAAPSIIGTMSDCMSQGVDIQLRILQTLLSLITNFPSVHGELLGDALLLCFRLQESRIAVVSSTAAATLRQLVMFVVDKVVDEDRREDSRPELLSEKVLPNGTHISLGPSAVDAYAVFEDLCLLANGEKPNFLKLEFLRKTFALELIESVLTNYHDLFRKHPELLLLLQHHLCPFVLKALSDRPNFPLTLRSTRVVFLLLKQFSAELKTESEVFLMLLIKIIGADTESGTPAQSTESFHLPHGARPQWMRVLAMEIMRGLCSDAELMRNIWNRYDAEETGSKVFSTLVSALKRLVTEKPPLLGVGSQMYGVGVPAHPGPDGGHGLDVGGVAGMAGMVANAASATVSNVVGMIGSEAGLSVQGSAMKVQCIDQLDKSDSPPIPEPYIYLIGVQCLVSLCDGFAAFTGPLYNTIMVQRPRSAGEPVIRAPPALDLSSLPQEEPTTRHLKTVHDMVECGWPALLAALSFLISTNLSDELFADVLGSYQSMTNVSGMLGLNTPQDAFFTSLSKFAIPTRVVSSLENWAESSTPRTPSTLSENLGLSGPTQPPGLSERNMACLKVLIASALFLAGSLGESWFNILEALQNADYVLTTKGAKFPPSKRSAMGPGVGSAIMSRAASLAGTQSGSSAGKSGSSLSSPGVQAQQQPKHPMLAELDSEALQAAIQKLFDASKNMDDGAFSDFVKALCKLSSVMVGMQSGDSEGSTGETELSLGVGGAADLTKSPKLTIPESAAHRRRVSGIHLPRTLRSGDFGINRLGGVATLNIHRLIYRDPEVAWDTITSHLLAVIKHTTAPASIRIQAAKTLDEILTVVPRNLSTTGELQPKVQRRVLDVLSQQVIGESGAVSNTSVELRRMGLETLHTILQASGHTLVVGWETIFEMLGSVCRPAIFASSSSADVLVSSPISPVTPRGKPPPLGYASEKGYTSLVKIAFQSLTLVCDSLGQLSPEHLRLCISTLGQFGRQADTNIALTAAESLLWGVSDSIQAKRKDAEKEPEYSALWMFLLLEILGLCTDGRPEVRVGAIQTLFRTLQLYGATLSLATWDECIWKVTFPLLDAINGFIRQARTPLEDGSTPEPEAEEQWDDSKILALQSVGSIFHDFLTSKILHLNSFEHAWEVFVGHVHDSWLHDNRTINPPALRCLDKAIRASAAAGPEFKSRVLGGLGVVWSACEDMGGVLLKDPSSMAASSPQNVKPFTQESLMAFVDVIRSTRSAIRQFHEPEWTLERLTSLMSILKGVLTYPNSPDFRADVDSLSPVQADVLEAVDAIDLSSPGAPSLILRDLSEYSTLPFLAAFDVPEPPAPPTSSTPRSRTQKRVTYIALSKKTMPQLVDLFLRFKEHEDIYLDGTIEAIFAAYSIPIKMKYECPAPSKYGKDLPLWKTATTSFLKIIKECANQIQALGDKLPDDRVEGIWRQVVDTFRGGILADCSIADTFTLDVQESEENFDLALIASLEIDVVPHLGDPRVPDYIISQLARVLLQGSQLRDEDEYQPPSPRSLAGGSGRSSQDYEKVERFGDHSLAMGTTDVGRFLPRERFSYWCFDLLFLICSDTAQDQIPSRKRVAALSISPLLTRCRKVLVSYVADEALRGNLPFSRTREEELLYVLRKLLELRLWQGTLWAALSDDPSRHCLDPPDIDPTLGAPGLIADSIKRSTRAHLFHFYPIMCEIVAIPRKTPTAWVMQSPRLKGKEIPNKGVVAAVEADEGKAVALDARALVKECLKEIGREMGVGH